MFIKQVSLIMDYEMMMFRRMMMRGDYHERRHPKKSTKKGKERLVNPKEFSQVYEHPLSAFMPLVEYLSGVRVEQSNERHQKQDNWRRYEQDQRMRFRQWMRYYEREEEEEVEPVVDAHQQLALLVRKQPDRTFLKIKEGIIKQFSSNKASMDKNRKDNVNFIENNLGFNLRAYNLLNKDSLEQNWSKVQALIKHKLVIITQTFEEKKPLLAKVKQFEMSLNTSKNAKQQIKPLKQLTPVQQSSIFKLILLYLALPTHQQLHQQITTFERKSREIFKKFSSQEDQLKRMLRNLPYKESSYYWSKIIECCRYITQCDHYRDLEDRRVDTFQAEYAGTITHDILKRLMEKEWLDNSITSAVIEYLKQVEGTNNYHNDNNFRACLFTHSETDIFINNQRDTDNCFAYEKLIFLVNIPNQHWFVIAVYISSGEIVVYDSLGTYPEEYNNYCQKIVRKLKRKRPDAQFKRTDFNTPKQNNVSDCGVFSIINIICVLDKEGKAQRKNNFNTAIVPQIRHSLFLFLLYLGYCKRFQVVPRKDYFDILFRSTIHSQLKSRLHEEKRKSR